MVYKGGTRGLHMAAQKNDLKDHLARYREIKLMVVGRNSGKTISNPVWFVLEGEKIFLLPVKGSNTQWYKNVLKERKIRIESRDVEARVTAKPITESVAVKSVIDKFCEKYGASDVKKYYSKFDVAVSVELAESGQV
jgi:hypothetical protein